MPRNASMTCLASAATTHTLGSHYDFRHRAGFPAPFTPPKHRKRASERKAPPPMGVVCRRAPERLPRRVGQSSRESAGAPGHRVGRHRRLQVWIRAEGLRWIDAERPPTPYSGRQLASVSRSGRHLDQDLVAIPDPGPLEPPKDPLPIRAATPFGQAVLEVRLLRGGKLRDSVPRREGGVGGPCPR